MTTPRSKLASSPEVTLEGVAKANAAELERLLEQHLEELTPALARQVLRNPHLTREGIEALLSRRALRTSYELKVALVRHRLTSTTVAMSLTHALYWRDLAWLARELAVPPLIRRQTERLLEQRLPGLSLGERIALARIATGGVLHQMSSDQHPRVIAALLSNPKLTEGLVVRLAGKGRSATVLEQLAASPRWGNRRGVVAALANNPATPVAVALRLLSGLDKRKLRAVAANPALSTRVRKRARLLTGW